MRAARFHGPVVPLVIEDVARPETTDGEILVRVAGTGICHSDLHILQGNVSIPGTPLIIGHEITGYVELAPEQAHIEVG